MGNIHTHWRRLLGCKGEHTDTLVLLAGVQGGTYRHAGLTGGGARGNIQTHWSCWRGCKGEHTHTLVLLAGVQRRTYTHTGLTRWGARGNIHTQWSCWRGCKGEHTETLVLLAGVQGGTYRHTGLAGQGARRNIHTSRPFWMGCKGEHTHTLSLLAGVQGGTYTHTGLAGRGARGNIHIDWPCWQGCKGEHTHTLVLLAGVQGGTREYQEGHMTRTGVQVHINCTPRPRMSGREFKKKKAMQYSVWLHSYNTSCKWHPRYLLLERLVETLIVACIMLHPSSSKGSCRPLHLPKHRELVHQHNLGTSSQHPQICLEPIPVSAQTEVDQQYSDR